MTLRARGGRGPVCLVSDPASDRARTVKLLGNDMQLKSICFGQKLVGILFLILAPSVVASDVEIPADDEVVAKRGGVVITVGDLKAKIRSQIPPEGRRGFLMDGQKVAGLLETTLLTGQLAKEAESQGLHQDPRMIEELEHVRQDVLARNQVEVYLQAQPVPDYEVLARELYQADKASHVRPRQIDVRHVLIAVDERGEEEEALALAEKVRSLALSGEDFGELVSEYSKRNPGEDGWLRHFTPEGFDEAFAQGVATLSNEGDISSPVRSSYGYHVIKLEKVVPARQLSFDEVKLVLMDEARSRFISGTRRDYISSFSNQPVTLNDEVIARLKLIDQP